MTKLETEITNALYEVYYHTTEPYHGGISSKTVLVELEDGRNKEINIVRVRQNGKLEYILHIDMEPFMTVFGCWPIGYVADVFCRTVQHYYGI